MRLFPSTPKTERPRALPETPWHLLLAILLEEEGSPGFEVMTEVELRKRPLRADFLLLRRKSSVLDAKARVLRRLWGWIKRAALCEFKSASRPLRRGDVSVWLAGAYLHDALLASRDESGDRQAVLVVVSQTPTLARECARLGASLHSDGGGYYTFAGLAFDARLVVLNEVAEAEREPLLGLFSGRTMGIPRVQQWMVEHGPKVMATMGNKLTQANRDFLTTFLASLSPKDRLAGLGPEERLAGLGAEQILLALPDDALRALSPAYVASLPIAVRRKITARVKKSGAAPATPKRRPRRS